jgi:hypothetical protein
MRYSHWIGVIAAVTLSFSMVLGQDAASQPSTLPTSNPSANGAMPIQGAPTSGPAARQGNGRAALDPMLVDKAPILANDVIQGAERIEVVAVDRVRQAEPVGILGHKTIGDTRVLTALQAQQLKTMLLSKDSHMLGARARCRFRPTHGITFVRGESRIALLVNAGKCPKWGHLKGEKLKAIDLRKPAAAILKALMAEVFLPQPKGQ